MIITSALVGSLRINLFAMASHKGTGFTPKAFAASKDEEAWLCQCKQTGNAPYCDGSHTKVPEDQIGQAFQLEKESDADAMPTPQATAEEPYVALIHQLAEEGLSKLGHHGPMGAMGVPREELPSWDDLQLMVAQLARKPLLEDVSVKTELVIGPAAKKPLHLKIPLFVSDMSFGALSEEAKVALARGANLVGTGICSGEGGMLPDEQEANERYFYELASAKFGFREELLERVQAFHFKCGQGAKTGTGGHLPGMKNIGRISEVRGIPEGTPAVSPPTFTDLSSVADFKQFGDRVREVSGGIPIGFKLSAQHIERDIEFALAAGADYIILDGRGGGTGAAPLLFSRSYFSADDSCLGTGATLFKQGRSQRAGNPDYYRRLAHPCGFHQGTCTRCRWRCDCQLGNAGHWLCGCQDLQYEPLSGGHRHAKTGVA